MPKKTIIIILSVIVAAATAAIELLSSCSTGTIFQRVTPADSVYYERHVNVRPGSLSRVYPFVPLQHNVRDGLKRKISSQKTKSGEHRCVALAHQGHSLAESTKRSAIATNRTLRTIRETDRRSAFFSMFNSKIYRYVQTQHLSNTASSQRRIA